MLVYFESYLKVHVKVYVKVVYSWFAGIQKVANSQETVRFTCALTFSQVLAFASHFQNEQEVICICLIMKI